MTKKFLIDFELNNLKIFDNDLLIITQPSKRIEENELVQSKRVGINKAINLKWRWYLRQSRSISKRVKGDKNPPLKHLFNKSA